MALVFAVFGLVVVKFQGEKLIIVINRTAACGANRSEQWQRNSIFVDSLKEDAIPINFRITQVFSYMIALTFAVHVRQRGNAIQVSISQRQPNRTSQATPSMQCSHLPRPCFAHSFLRR